MSTANKKDIRLNIKRGIYVQLNKEGLINSDQLDWLLNDIN